MEYRIDQCCRVDEKDSHREVLESDRLDVCGNERLGFGLDPYKVVINFGEMSEMRSTLNRWVWQSKMIYNALVSMLPDSVRSSPGRCLDILNSKAV